MLVEDDFSLAAGLNSAASMGDPASFKYPDLIDFIVSDIDQIKKNKTHYVLDEKAFEKNKQVYDEAYRILQEDLITMNIEKINNYTSFIDLSRIFYQVSMPEDVGILKNKRRYIVDEYIMKTFQQQRIINWIKCTNWLYPISTIGDGNCLCNAVLSYISGQQDSMMWLRDTLKNYMNREDILPRLKERWIQDRKLFYGNEAADLKIEEDQKILEREWAEIVSMTRRDNSAASQTKSNNLAKETQESGEAVPAGETTSSGGINQPLTYLEDIHIFALANLLRRPIIVLAQEFYRNIEPIRLRGIYLPLLVSAKNTVKDPILIGYHSNHFVPLMFALDDRDRERIRSSRESDKDEIPLHYNKEYFYLYNVDAVQDSTHASRDPIGFREKVNQMIKPSPNDIINDDTFKRQEHVFYNLLPLCYSDFSMMKIHFQLDDEKKKEMRLLKAYLILLSISYDFAELDRSHQSEIRDKFDHKDVLCCSLTHDSKVTLKNGVSSYLDFLNQSIKSTRSVREDDSSLWPKANRSVLGSLVNRESPIAAAGLNNYSSDNSIYAKSNSLLYNNSALKNYCKNSTCVNEGFARYNDFCLKCYERIEQERPASSNNRYVIKQEPANENVQSSRQSLNVCANLKCQAVIVSSQFRHNDSPSRYCDRCRKEKKDLEYESTNKSSYTIPVYSTNRQPSGPTEIPIKFETNRNPTRSTNAENMYSGYNRSYPMQSDTLNYDSSLNSRYRTFPVRRRVSCTYCHKEFYVDSNLPHTPNFCDQCLAYFNNR